MKKQTQHGRAAHQRPTVPHNQRATGSAQTKLDPAQPLPAAVSSAPANVRTAPPLEPDHRTAAAPAVQRKDRPKLKFEPVPQLKAAQAGNQPRHAPAAAPTKVAQITELLRRPQGAGIAELMTVTGWQAHSVRGALSGAIKTKLKLNVVSEKAEAGRVYRIVQEAVA